ncbi:MAG: hypothetical protein HS111_20520 [Kofleriaceae bacterium]|nr:hypothetical protein [Kofleriaceae bacterium]MCL4226257.1 hypothetical protein [Myxococcales bacterium]
MRLSSAVSALASVLVAAPLAACGGDALDPGAGDDPGTGSLTLLVDADLEATPVVTNAASADGFRTRFHVAVRKDDAPVTAGEVVVTSNGGAVSLTYDAGEARWRGEQAGYHEVYVLSVTSGDDFVDGVRVDGPAPHHFTSPAAGATVDAAAPLVVRWARGEAAAVARFETEALDELEVADSGTFTVPIGGLRSKPGEPEQERLRLDRFARVTPAGAVAGSSVRVEVRNELALVVAATGL